jgi:hypothetical protein
LQGPFACLAFAATPLLINTIPKREQTRKTLQKKWKVPPWPENLPFLHNLPPSYTPFGGPPKVLAQKQARPLANLLRYFFFFFAVFFAVFFAAFFFAFFFAIIYHLLSVD